MPLPKEWGQKGELTIKDLIAVLIKKGFLDKRTQLQSHRRTIWDWEKAGTIPKPKYKKLPNGWNARVYSKEDIDEIVKVLNSYPIKKTLTC